MNKREVMKVENLVRNYKMVHSDRQDEEEIKVLKGLDFTIEEQEFVGIMGKSGCGKTTLLRILGGFLEADEGSVIFDGEEISNKPPYERELNTVFQKYALFPHLSVYENIAFGMKVKKLPKAEIDRKIREVAKKIKITDEQLQKNVSELSDWKDLKTRIQHCSQEASSSVLQLQERLSMSRKCCFLMSRLLRLT